MDAARAGAVRAIVFDFDGLLMDTESTSFLSWQYEWGQWGLALEAADFFVDHGGDVTEDRYATLAAAAGPRFDRALSHRRRVAYREQLHEELDPAGSQMAIIRSRGGRCPGWLGDGSGHGGSDGHHCRHRGHADSDDRDCDPGLLSLRVRREGPGTSARRAPYGGTVLPQAAPESQDVTKCKLGLRSGEGAEELEQEASQRPPHSRCAGDADEEVGRSLHVSVSTTAKGLPVVAVVASTGANAAVIGDVAKQVRLYAQTLFLAEKYDLPLPANLAGTVTSPVAVGLLVDSASYPAAFALAGGVLAAAGLLALITPEPHDHRGTSP